MTQGLQDAGIKVTHVQFDSTLTDLLGPQTNAVNANTLMWSFFDAHPFP